MFGFLVPLASRVSAARQNCEDGLVVVAFFGSSDLRFFDVYRGYVSARQ